MTLVPLKTVEPFVIRGDNSTSIVEALKEGPINIDETITRYFAAQYVCARQGFKAEEVQHHFQTISLLSSPEEQERFAGWYMELEIRKAHKSSTKTPPLQSR